jgi:alpha-methylacyl-CoA racemase
MTETVPNGPLTGLRVIEMVGVGPAPFCGMLLADMGADVVRIDRLGGSDLGVRFPVAFDLLNRNKRSLALDLKHSSGIGVVRRMARNADVLIEGFRPGVMERLGLGPDDLHVGRSKLVYGRMTGWGQDGPLAKAAGHDINYIAITGCLDAMGRDDGKPTIPLNLIGDFGGGTLYLAMGVLAAVIEARRSGIGQTIDCAIIDGVTNLLTMHHAMNQMGAWQPRRGTNIIDGGAPFYDVYETSDGRYVSVGAIEPKFYKDLIERIGLVDAGLPDQYDKSGWARLRAEFTSTFKSKTSAEWCAILEGTDACFAPVLTIEEAAHHPQNAARTNLVEAFGALHSVPAPRFSRTPGFLRRAPSAPGVDSAEALSAWGFLPGEIEALSAAGITPSSSSHDPIAPDGTQPTR